MKVDGLFWRRLAFAGARHGPTAFIRHSPSFIGMVMGALLPEQREQVRRNLRAARGKRSSVAELADVYRTFAEFAHCLAESLGADRTEGRNAQIEVVGRVNMEQLLAAGEGAIIVTAHSGGWDVAARLLRRDFGVDVMVVMAREPDGAARSFHDEIREHAGIQVTHIGGHPLDALPIGIHLKRGGVVAIQLDRVPAGSASTEVPFLGGSLRVPIGPFQLAAVTRAPIVPIFTRRLGFFRYEVNISEPLRIRPRPSQAELRACAVETAREMQRFIQSHPTQWFHFVA